MDLVGLCARVRLVLGLWVAGDQPTSGRGQAGGVLTVPFWCSSCEGGPAQCERTHFSSRPLVHPGLGMGLPVQCELAPSCPRALIDNFEPG